MSDVASIIADMVRAGVDASLIGRVAQALSEREAVPVKIVDEQAERRRASDRERKRLRNSAESAEFHKKEIPPTPPKENIPLSPPKGGTFPKNSDLESFPAFWEAYPNKTGKPKALEAYRKALRKTTAEQILSGLSAAKRHDNRFRDRQFTPMPATWLNNDGWADEHDAPASAAASSPNDHTAGWTEQRWRLSVDLAVQNGRWEPKWGPPPDDPQTLCPMNLRPLWKKAA